MLSAGIALTIGGVLVVSVARLVWPEPSLLPPGSPPPSQLLLSTAQQNSGSNLEAIIGIALVLLSILFLAGRLVAEEVALESTSFHPLQVLGYEGMWGSFLTAISLIIVWRMPGSDVGQLFACHIINLRSCALA